MISKTITYTDFNGTERTETHYFHFSKAELVELRLSKVGGLDNYIREIIAARDESKLIELFKDLVLKAYGQKSEDGRRFIKSEAMREEFSQTQAYSDIFMELATNEEAATAFVNGVIPKDL